MRQAGLKPKAHSSGVYWVRANAKNGGNGSGGSGDDKWTDGNPNNVIEPKQKLIAFMICFWGLILAIGLSFIFF